MDRVVTIDEQVWRAQREPGVAVGARAPGDYDVQSQSPGVWFHADDGARRFTSLDASSLPREEAFPTVPLEQLVSWFHQSAVM